MSQPTFKLADALAIYTAIQGLKSVRVEIAVAAKILAVEKWARPHAAYFMEKREEIASKLGTKLAELKWSIGEENLAAFTEMVTELGLTEIDPPPPDKISMACLREAVLTPSDLSCLSPFLE